MDKLLLIGRGSETVPYELNEDSTELRYTSFPGYWNFPGKKAYSLKSTGEGYVFKDHHTKKTVKLDSCQIEALMVLLEIKGERTPFKIYNEEE